MDRKPLKVGTIGDQQELRHAVRLLCDKCRHGAVVDLPALIGKFGADFKLQWLVERASCSKCGARWPELDLSLSPITADGNGR